MVLAGCVYYVNSLVRPVQGQPRIVQHVCKGIHSLTTSVLLNVRLGIFETLQQVNVTCAHLNVQAVWGHQHIALVVQLVTNFSYRQCHAFLNVLNTRSHKVHFVLHANIHVSNAHLKLNVLAVSLAV